MQRKNKIPIAAALAKQWLERLEAESKQNSNEFIEKCLTRQSAIDAVDRIFKYGKTETGRKLDDSLWFRDQLRLTADMRLSRTLTTGASQISKSLGNYLVAIDALISGRVNLGWFYASRQSMFNQQPEQFQKMALYWLQNAGMVKEINRESVTRYSVGNSVANFSYANSSTESKSGGASEGKEQASFSASILFLEERSSWRSTVDVTPRLGASLLPSKPIRELGTPGAGAGIESQMKNAAHLFCPAVFCPHCGDLTYLDPKGALLKPVEDKRTKVLRYFNARGEILDFYSKDGTAKTAFVACLSCGGEITADLIAQCRLYCRKTGVSAEGFLDRLPEGEVYSDSVAIYLSPLLRVPSDPFRIQELVVEGLEPQNPSIYQQNKLGHQSETDTTGISIADIEIMEALPAWEFEEAELDRVITVLGLDQGRDSHWITILQFQESNPQKVNILLADSVAHHEVIPIAETFGVMWGFIDNEPERLAAYAHVIASSGKFAIADQKSFEGDIKPIKVLHGGRELPCFGINQNLYKDQLVAGFKDPVNFRIAGKLHHKFRKHMTSVKRNPDTLVWERPGDHDDDLFFATMFALAAFQLELANPEMIQAEQIAAALAAMS